MKNLEKIVNLCKNRGFIFPGSEIYGGLSNSWDYGPLGVLLKNNIKKAWLKKFVQENKYNLGLDSAILSNRNVWIASGHLSNFSDPLLDCKNCKSRFRADKLLEEKGINPNFMSFKQMSESIEENNIECPNCKAENFTSIRKFNLMFKTFQGVIEDNKNEIFLRPETAQGIFINFSNILRASRKKIPFGVAQIGKAFRNEITPGNFIFRTREFEQMELEFFCEPGTDSEWFNYWKNFCKKFLLNLNIKEKNIRLRDHEKEELSHYSKETVDIEFSFPFGWGELWGIANRTDFDLKTHQEHSNKNLEYFDPKINKKFTPYVIEPSLGADRVLLAFLCNSYEEEKLENQETRIVLKFHPFLAPYKACVLPLSKKLNKQAEKIYEDLSKCFMTDYDETGSIGKRYRRQDEIGTPFCITYDFESEKTNTVTIRHRDSIKQKRISVNNLIDYIEKKIEF
ncbi:MAG: glycine--tRNA ligase [Candidatus Paraimprobicoccus trichonymphae]|uniref:Glycine--tRNA ligase n=1 Tax=Candidatus Paraimprobicoccus trichonymphae TaxID=3033793 RepID=A0AA48I3J0_9FIRM|nr:MAG: glycine--tRNA ligase [Candidatus Paraimprobicoccus trichonymphae]